MLIDRKQPITIMFINKIDQTQLCLFIHINQPITRCLLLDITIRFLIERSQSQYVY